MASWCHLGQRKSQVEGGCWEMQYGPCLTCVWLEKPCLLSHVHSRSQQKQKMTVQVPPVLPARRNSPFFLAILFCLLQSSDWALRALTKEKMLHSIFRSLLLWGMCKMRSSQCYMRSIPNSLCNLRADSDLTIYCILNRSTMKWMKESLSSHQLGVVFS